MNMSFERIRRLFDYTIFCRIWCLMDDHSFMNTNTLSHRMLNVYDSVFLRLTTRNVLSEYMNRHQVNRASRDFVWEEHTVVNSHGRKICHVFEKWLYSYQVSCALFSVHFFHMKMINVFWASHMFLRRFIFWMTLWKILVEKLPAIASFLGSPSVLLHRW